MVSVASVRLGTKTPAFRVDPSTGEFIRILDGERVTALQVREAIEAVIAGAKQQAADLMQDLRHRDIDVEQWHADMDDLITQVHSLAAAAAYTGLDRAQAQAEEELRNVLDRERQYLYGFAASLALYLAMGTPIAALASGQLAGASMSSLVARSASYMDAAAMTYERVRWYVMQLLDFTEAQRVLRPGGEHCNGCLTQARKGWVPIAELVPLGQEDCGQWCTCTVDYRKTNLYVEGGS